MEIYQQILNLFNNDTEETFNNVSLQVFKTQAEHNPTYRRFLSLINCEPKHITNFKEIPLMPISFFKTQKIKTKEWNPVKVFLSSGSNSDSLRSKHLVKNLDWYDKVTRTIFEVQGRKLENYEVLALLPNYIENGDSSLVHMVDNFQRISNTSIPASYLYEHEALASRIRNIIASSQKKVLLLGVTYALIDFAAKFSVSDSRLELLFTGGMKNKKKELSYAEIKNLLAKSFPLSIIRAEYGMTELFSQAYSNSEDDNYNMPSTMRILTKEIQDPITNCKIGKSGLLGIIDLANYDTASFILTEDIGNVISDREFMVLGRVEQSDLRGCNLLYESD